MLFKLTESLVFRSSSRADRLKLNTFIFDFEELRREDLNVTESGRGGTHTHTDTHTHTLVTHTQLAIVVFLSASLLA